MPKIRKNGLYVIAAIKDNVVYAVHKFKIFDGEEVIKYWDKHFGEDETTYAIYELGALIPVLY